MSSSAFRPRRTPGSLTVDLAPVRAAPGVVCVLTAADMPGENDVSPTHRHDEPLLATDLVEFVGQPLFAVVADTRDQARRAARLAVVEYEELPAVLDVDAARAAGSPGHRSADAAPRRCRGRDRSPRRAGSTGRMAIGGQEHFYLEGQIALAIPGEDDEVTV